MSKISNSTNSQSIIRGDIWARRIPALAEAYSDRNAGEVRCLTAEILKLGTRGQLKEHEGPAAYWHPLGFFRIELGEDSVGLRYALDVWPEEDRHTQEPAWLVHRHIWDLESLVIHGSLVDTEYDRHLKAPENIAAISISSLYNAIVAPDHSVLLRTDQQLILQSVEESTVNTERFYRVDIGRFHSTDVPFGKSVATLIRRGPKLRRHSQVAGTIDGPAKLRYERRPVTQEIVEYGIELALT